ncbi:MAG: aconitase family protein [Candidatus Aminicenantales bacterium]
MGMTMTQKILAAHAGLDVVRPGDLIEANVDLVLGSDVIAPPAIREFRRFGGRVFDPGRIVLVPDHFAPNKGIASAERGHLMREFAREQGIVHYFETGRKSIAYGILPEQGLIGPGDLVVGADSHTRAYGALGAFSTGIGSADLAAAMLLGKCWLKTPAAIMVDLTGALSGRASGKDVILAVLDRIGVDGVRSKSLEFRGPGLGSLSFASRLTAANMAVEAGAKNVLFPADEITAAYLGARLKREGRAGEADGDAEYERALTVDLSSLRPPATCPRLSENIKLAADVGAIPVE